jgi:hypothetical protein
MFGDLLAELTRAAGELVPIPSARSRNPAGPRVSEPIEPEPAPLSDAAVSDESFLDLVADCGLGDLANGARSLAVRGARLSKEAGAATTSSDPAGIPAAIEIDLSTVPHPSPWPDSGALRVEIDADSRAGGERGPLAVALSLGPAAEPPLVGFPELTLPRAWSASAQALGLGPDQLDRWEELRWLLAEAHGVELTDEPSRPFAIHRLFGYPDERTGQMPVWSELLERGVDLGGEPVFMHPMSRRVAEEAGRWRLLLQLSRDPRLGWRWGAGLERLYVWVPAEELEAGHLDHPRAFVL